MQDRRPGARSAARFVALAVAGLAVAATSQAVPSVAPQQLSSSGTAHLDAGQRTAVVPIVVTLESGTLNGLAFRVDLQRPANGIAAIIVPTDAPGNRPPNGPTSPTAGQTMTFSASCSAMPCAHRFAIVFVRSGGSADVAIDIPWALGTTATFLATSSSSPPPGRVTIVAGPVTAPGAIAAAKADSGASVRLSERDRFRVWRIDLVREAADGDLEGAATVAVLGSTASQTAGGAFPGNGPKDRRIAGREDPPVQVRLIGPSGGVSTSWVPDGPLAFEPFNACDADQRCDATIIAQLAWADGRPDTAFDAAWSLAVRSLAAKGSPGAVSIHTEELPPLAMANASAEGSFEAGSGVLRGQSRIVANLDPSVLDGGGWPLSLVPGRGVATVRVTSVGTTPVPANAEIVVGLDSATTTTTSGMPSSGITLTPGGSGTFAFEPLLRCATNGISDCTFDATLSTSVTSPNATDTAGMAVRVDWTIDLAIRVRPGGSLTIAVDPLASTPPRIGPSGVSSLRP